MLATPDWGGGGGGTSESEESNATTLEDADELLLLLWGWARLVVPVERPVALIERAFFCCTSFSRSSACATPGLRIGVKNYWPRSPPKWHFRIVWRGPSIVCLKRAWVFPAAGGPSRSSVDPFSSILDCLIA